MIQLTRKNREIVVVLGLIIFGIVLIYWNSIASIIFIVLGMVMFSQLREKILIAIKEFSPFLKRLLKSETQITQGNESVNLYAGRDIKAGRDLHVKIEMNKRKEKRKK